jgi:hypothetical protein
LKVSEIKNRKQGVQMAGLFQLRLEQAAFDLELEHEPLG